MKTAEPIVEPWLRLTGYQESVLLVPECYDLALLGGRGGGKSYGMVALAIRHVAQHGARARVLFVRQSFPGLLDVETTLRELVPRAFEGAVYNSQSHVWRVPNGGTIELGILETAADLTRYQGRNYSLVIPDEAGEWADFALVDRLRANLRAPEGVRCRFVLAGNPGGPGHAGLAKRFVLGREPWVPFVDKATGAEFVLCPSTFDDNEHLDREAYRRQLEAATAGDPELGRAWLSGSWTIQRGAFFGLALDESRAAFGPWTPDEFHAWAVESGRYRGDRWRPELFLAHDFGVAAPSVTFVLWRSDGRAGPDGRFYSRGSVLALDELATNEPNSLTRGMGYTVPTLAEQIVDLAKAWRMRPHGCADDAIFAKTGSSAGSIADEFKRAGVDFTPARKADRVTGWSLMRTMFSQAGAPDVPGLYLSRRCVYAWQTIPSLPRDPRRPEDVDSRAADHAADALRYGVLWQPAQFSTAESASLIGI
ncbi:MAG: hypothetical protein AMXMBFR36_27880 [Acidobacteriota bacterium]